MRRIVPGLASLAAVAALAGCGGTGGATWPGPGDADADGRLEVASYNEFLSGDGERYARSPIAAVTEYLRLDETTAASTAVIARASSEGRSPVTVEVTLDRLLDDSVRARFYVLELRRTTEETWRIRSAAVTQRCWRGRGHTVFSPKPCV